MTAESLISDSVHTSAPESRAAQLIRGIVESGRPLTYVRSPEEQRIGIVLREVGSRLAPPLPVWSWSLTEGLQSPDGLARPDTRDPIAALDFIAHFEAGAIFHLKDFHEPLRTAPEVRRKLRDLYESALDQSKFVVISSPVREIPEELERSVLYVELRPPDRVELAAFLRSEGERLGGTLPDEDAVYQLASALQGLTLDEARYAIRRAVAGSRRLGPESHGALLEEKRLLVNRSGVIEYISTNLVMSDVGGLENLKKWLLERRKLFRMADSLSAEILPKGVLIMGIPGCGKSLCIKAVASYFELPLYRVDMVAIFSGRFGKPESAFVQACHLLEDMAPAVLWFDEIEMGLTSADSGGEQGRIFAFFLTWMQEKTPGLFVAATANRIDLLPAEMIRKGRFDEVFFVDLPVEEERTEIFRIHLQRRAVRFEGFKLEQLTDFTTGWTGAEIEQCVVSAITRARLESRDLVEQDLIRTAVGIVPLSRTMKEQIDHIRGWAYERAVRATPRQSGR